MNNCQNCIHYERLDEEYYFCSIHGDVFFFENGDDEGEARYCCKYQPFNTEKENEE